MKLVDLFETIESHSTAGQINLASHFAQAVRLVQEHTAFGHLLNEITERSKGEKVLRRVLELAENGVDVRYENPYDVALMMYALALLQQQPPIASIASAALLRVPRLWWALKVATMILEHQLDRSESAERPPSLDFLAFDGSDKVVVAQVKFAHIYQSTEVQLRQHSSSKSRIIQKHGRNIVVTNARDSGPRWVAA